MFAAIGSTRTAATSAPCSASAASSAARSLYGTTIVSATVPGVTPAEPGQPERRDAAARPRRAARRRGRGSSRRTSRSSSRPVAPRASRTAVIAASVPDDTSRTFSTDGTRSQIASASSTSRARRRAVRRAVGRGALHRLDDRRVRVAEDRRAPRLHVVEVLAAVGVDEVRAVARGRRRTARRRPTPNARTGEFDAARECAPAPARTSRRVAARVTRTGARRPRARSR